MRLAQHSQSRFYLSRSPIAKQTHAPEKSYCEDNAETDLHKPSALSTHSVPTLHRPVESLPATRHQIKMRRCCIALVFFYIAHVDGLFGIGLANLFHRHVAPSAPPPALPPSREITSPIKSEETTSSVTHSRHHDTAIRSAKPSQEASGSALPPPPPPPQSPLSLTRQSPFASSRTTEPCILPSVVKVTSKCCTCHPSIAHLNGSTTSKRAGVPASAGRYGCYEEAHRHSRHLHPVMAAQRIWVDQRCAGLFECADGNRILCGTSRHAGRTNCTCAPLPPRPPAAPPRPLRPRILSEADVIIARVHERERQAEIERKKQHEGSKEHNHRAQSQPAPPLVSAPTPTDPLPQGVSASDDSTAAAASTATAVTAEVIPSSPSNSAVVIPSSPSNSCWVRYPSGCHPHSGEQSPPSELYSHDSWGESHGYHDGKEGCARRRQHLNHWCGVKDVETYHVPAVKAEGGAPGPSEAPSHPRNSTSPETKASPAQASRATTAAINATAASSSQMTADCKPFCHNLPEDKSKHICKCKACSSLPAKTRLTSGSSCA